MSKKMKIPKTKVNYEEACFRLVDKLCVPDEIVLDDVTDIIAEYANEDKKLKKLNLIFSSYVDCRGSLREDCVLTLPRGEAKRIEYSYTVARKMKEDCEFWYKQLFVSYKTAFRLAVLTWAYERTSCPSAQWTWDMAKAFINVGLVTHSVHKNGVEFLRTTKKFMRLYKKYGGKYNAA